jgi:hypothetical protein
MLATESVFSTRGLNLCTSFLKVHKMNHNGKVLSVGPQVSSRKLVSGFRLNSVPMVHNFHLYNTQFLNVLVLRVEEMAFTYGR